MGVILTLIVLVAAGFTLGAERSMPGDALYPVKVGVNEKVQGWFAVSNKAESEHAVTLAARRLEEAEKLRAQGRLNEEARAQLQNEFNADIALARKEIEELETEGRSDDAASIRAELDGSIRARGIALGLITTGQTSGTEDQEKTVTVKTDQGDLALAYKNDILTLSGTLMRSTPCINWNVDTTITKDKPPSNVTFAITSKSTAEVCIQVLGTPQEIKASTEAAQNANIQITLNGKIVFNGKLQ